MSIFSFFIYRIRDPLVVKFITLILWKHDFTIKKCHNCWKYLPKNLLFTTRHFSDKLNTYLSTRKYLPKLKNVLPHGLRVSGRDSNNREVSMNFFFKIFLSATPLSEGRPFYKLLGWFFLVFWNRQILLVTLSVKPFKFYYKGIINFDVNPAYTPTDFALYKRKNNCFLNSL